MKRLIAFAPAAILCAVLAVLGYYNFHKSARFDPRAMVGKPAPSLELNGLRDASQTDLQALAAKYRRPILVNIFASWCETCKAETPLMMELKEQGVIIIGVAHKDEPLKSLNFLEVNGDPYTEIYSREDGRIWAELGLSGLPETFLVGPDGIIRDKVGGPLTRDNVQPLLAGLGATGPTQKPK